jgi:two-component system, chemotaxis family, CheB/CheR fusion protein
LNRLSDDLTNTLTGTDIAIVLLGAGGKVRRFTPEAGGLLNLNPADVGRPIREIRANVEIEDSKRRSAGSWTAASPSKERSATGKAGGISSRSARNRTLANQIDGTILVFQDIDPIKRSLEEASLARDYAEALLETVRGSLVVLDEDFRVR